MPSPLAHQTGFLYGMWLAIVMGVPQIVQPVWNASRALRALNDWDGTFVQAATPFLADLVKAVEEGERPPAALRIFVATGAAVPRGLAERATRILGTAVCGAWGTTESCLGSLSAPGDEPAKVWGTDGRALRGDSLAHYRLATDASLPAGEEGHFEVQSPTMFDGYADHPEWTAAAFTPDGWFRTGDLGVMDESGYVRITGRVRDVINRGGEKIPVAEIEQLLSRPSGGRRDRDRRDARSAPRRTRLRLRRAATRNDVRLRADAALSRRLPSRQTLLARAAGDRRRAAANAFGQGTEVRLARARQRAASARARQRNHLVKQLDRTPLFDESSFAALKDEIAAYVAGPAEVWARRIERERHVPLELWDDLRARGYLSLAAPQPTADAAAVHSHISS